jgi:hypothetical protein
MGLVRRGGKVYLYQSVRLGGRVTSRYVSRGQYAELMAEAERAERSYRTEMRQLNREERQALVERGNRLDEAVAKVVNQAIDVARQFLESVGYHRHKRGEWRKQRGGPTMAGDLATWDTAAIEKLEGTEAVQRVRVLDRWVSSELLDLITGKDCDTNTKRVLRLEMIAEARVLAGPHPTPIEEMLARSAAFAWAFVRWNESQLAALAHDGKAKVPQIEFRERCLDRATRRHLAVLKTLATVRKLALPPLQVNVARNQVNQFHAGAPPGLPAEVGSTPTV